MDMVKQRRATDFRPLRVLVALELATSTQFFSYFGLLFREFGDRAADFGLVREEFAREESSRTYERHGEIRRRCVGESLSAECVVMCVREKNLETRYYVLLIAH